MTHTIGTLMELADEYTRLCTFMQEGTAAELAKKARAALITSLTEILDSSDVTLIDEGDIVHPMRRELRQWEKVVLGPPHPKDFGIPKEHWEAAQYYANFWHHNQMKATEVLK